MKKININKVIREIEGFKNYFTTKDEIINKELNKVIKIIKDNIEEVTWGEVELLKLLEKAEKMTVEDYNKLFEKAKEIEESKRKKIKPEILDIGTIPNKS